MDYRTYNQPIALDEDQQRVDELTVLYRYFIEIGDDEQAAITGQELGHAQDRLTESWIELERRFGIA